MNLIERRFNVPIDYRNVKDLYRIKSQLVDEEKQLLNVRDSRALVDVQYIEARKILAD